MQLAQFPLLQYNFIGRSQSVFKNLRNLAKLILFFSETCLFFSETLLSIWFTWQAIVESITCLDLA